MTCIVGIGNGVDTVTIGADSIAMAPDTLALTVRREPKVFTWGPHLLAAFSGSFALGDAIRFSPAPPPPETAVVENADTYLNEVVLPHLRAVVEEAGVAEGSIDGHQMLIGFQGRVFLIESLSQASSSLDGVEAAGAGDQLAIGAALALAGDAELSDEERVRAALHVAEQRSAGVRGPFQVLTLRS